MEFKIGKRKIGNRHPVFIVAEISGNHNQSYQRALEIIDAAASAGADAIKLQTYTPDTMTIDSDKKYFQVKQARQWRGKTLYQLYKEAQTPWEWQPKLKKYAEAKGLILFSAPFDATAVDFLEKMNVVVYKVASFEVVDIPLLKKIGQTKKPVIFSRGMASIDEIELAIKTLRENGTRQLAILQCVSAYPSQHKDMNLITIPDIAKRFHVTVGLSDHTLDSTAVIVSVGLGARIIEKHITLARADGGPDSFFSLEPEEFKKMVNAVRDAEASMGKPTYGAGVHEAENATFRRSLFVVEDIKKGEEFTSRNVRSIRPGQGLAPKHYATVIGKIASVDIKKGTPLDWDITQ